jgi:hypothetical protein
MKEAPMEPKYLDDVSINRVFLTELKSANKIISSFGAACL